MEQLKLKVDALSSGKRLDMFLVSASDKKFSRTYLKKLIDEGYVFVNNLPKSAHHKVSEGELVEISIPEPKALQLLPENIPIDVLYEDRDLLVVNKPAGMSVHPAGPRLTGTLVNALLFHTKDLSGIGGILRPGIVHRLDKDTSGLLVVAKNDNAHANLSGQFRNRKVERKYIALVKGNVQLDNGRIELPIARRKTDITKMGISFTDEKKKNAVTNYKVLNRFEDFTMLEVSLETGRTHQIRVHMAHIGHPVIGDRLYGSQKGLGRQALHAKTLGFFHPGTRKSMEFDSEIPNDMQGLIQRGKL